MSEMISTSFKAAIFFVSIVAFIGNILVTAAFLMDANLRTSINYFIANMAVSDLLSSLTNWPLYATEEMFSRKAWIEPSMATFACKLGMSSRVVSQAVSVLSLVLIVVDRYIATVLPFQAIKITTRRRAILMSFTWIIALSIVYPYYRFARIEEVGHHRLCRVSLSKIELIVYQTLVFVVFYCVPPISITILYSRIMKCLTASRPGDEAQLQRNLTARNRQQNQRVMKVFVWIVTVFFVSWTPLCVYLLFVMVYPSLFTIYTRMVFAGFCFYIFPTLSTAINPVIIFVSSSRFSKSLKGIFSCFACKPSPCCKGGPVSPERDATELPVVR